MDSNAVYEALRLLNNNDDPSIARAGASMLDRKNPAHREKILTRLRSPSTSYPVAASIVGAFSPFGTAFIEADAPLLLRLFHGWRRNGLHTDPVYRILERRASIIPANQLVALLPHDNAFSLLLAGQHLEAYEPARAFLLDEIPPDTIAAPIESVAKIHHPEVPQLLVEAYQRWDWNPNERVEFAHAFGHLLPARDAAKILQMMAADDRLELRVAAINALIEGGVSTERYLKALIER